MSYMRSADGVRLDSVPVGLNPNDHGYDIIVIAGQSNAAGGGGGTVNTQLNPVHSRIWQLPQGGGLAGNLIQASDPLLHPGTPTAVGPGMPAAREWLRHVSANRDVLLVPTALGSTGFTPTTVSGFTYTWDVRDSTTQINLANMMLAATASALTIAGANARIVGVLWVQGENDAGAMTQSSYASALDALIAAFRTQFGANIPWVIGQMVPSWQAANPTLFPPINAAHIDTPRRNRRTSFVYGPTFWESVNGQTNLQLVHYSQEGQRDLGQRMALSLLNMAPFNVTGTAPVPPAAVTATQSGTSLNVSWTPASGRATDWLVEYNTGSGWTTLSRTSPNLDTTATITGLSTGSVQVAVSTINEQGTSARTTITATLVAAPGAPTAVSAGTATSWTVPLTFTASAGATSYRAQKSTDGGTTWANAGLLTATASPVIAAGLTPGTSYQLRVVPINAAGNGTPSSAVSATTAAVQTLTTALGVTPSSAYSLRKINTGVKAIQVRRSSDNTTQDIGFTANGDLDTASLLTFVGSGDGFVSKWYDQGSRGYDFSQATAASQPQIVSAGVVMTDPNTGLPAVFFSGFTFLGGTPAAAWASAAITHLRVDNQMRNAWGNAACYTEYGSTAKWFPSFSTVPGNPNLAYLANGDTTGSSATNFKLAGYPLAQGTKQRSLIDSAGAWTAYEMGAAMISGTLSRAGAFTLTTAQIGAWISSNNYFGYMSELVFVLGASALSTAARQAAENNQRAYYGI